VQTAVAVSPWRTLSWHIGDSPNGTPSLLLWQFSLHKITVRERNHSL